MKPFKKLMFLVIVNPFTKTATFTHKDETVEIDFDAFDEWTTLFINNEAYDVHIHYEEKLTVSIYDIDSSLEADQTNTSDWHKVDLKIQINEAGLMVTDK